MKLCYCSSCKKNTWHKRAFGWGTLFAIIFTSGFWFLALPFYPVRCINCYYPSGSRGNKGKSLYDDPSREQKLMRIPTMLQ